MRIAVSGLAATYPYGGVFWDYAHYLLGFRALGHEVLYIEDTIQWLYDPTAGTFTPNGHSNAACLRESLALLDPALADRFHLRDANGDVFGQDWQSVREFCRDAELFVNISAACSMRDEYMEAERVALIDSDPMYTQEFVPAFLDGSIGPDARWRLERLRDCHDVFYTFGENIGAPDCTIPTELFDWIPTRQPVAIDALSRWRMAVDARRRVMTTVASWETKEGGPVVGGVQYHGKNHEFQTFQDLPRKAALPLEVALSGNAPREDLVDDGWQLVDPLPVSLRPQDYAHYLGSSLGEFSVAKHAYTASHSGWFSCRTACYLALGVPAVVQETGFSRFQPVGEGLFAFSTQDEALAGIDAIKTDPYRHADAATEIAENHFRAEKVLARLIESAFASKQDTRHSPC